MNKRYFTFVIALLLLRLAPAAVGGNCDAAPLHVPSPNWQDQVIYMLFIDRFQDGDRSNNDQGQGEYDPDSSAHFSGGDIQGIIDRLDYLKDLGVTALWITPPVYNQWWSTPYQATGWHGYWAVNFREVDPHFGTLADYQRLSRELHCRGMYLLQDIVANHTANFYTWDGGYDPADTARNFRLLEPDSSQPAPTQPPFHRIDRNNPEHAAANIYHWTPTLTNYMDRYQETNYMLGQLADLNTENPVVIDALKETYKYWIDAVGVDGFRIDTVMLVDHPFWHSFLHDEDGIYAHARSLGKEHFLTFGEAVSFSHPFQDGGERKVVGYIGSKDRPYLNSMLGYPLYFEISRVIGRGQPPAQLAHRLLQSMESYPDPYNIPNFIDNHDTPRFLNTGSNAAFAQALALLFTIPGIPVVYQGTEQALPQTRMAMFRGGVDNPRGSFRRNSRPYRLLQQLSALRREYPLLTRGTLEVIKAEDAGPGLLAWRRSSDGEGMSIIVNTADHATAVDGLPAFAAAGSKLQAAFQMNMTDTLTVDEHGYLRTVLPPRAVFVTQPTGDVRSATAAARSDVRIEAPRQNNTYRQDFILSGRTGTAGDLQLVQDGNMSAAIRFKPDAAGKWQVNVPVRDLGTRRHYLQVYDPVAGTLSERWNYTADVQVPAIDRTFDDPVGDDHGPTGKYVLPQHSESRTQKDIRSVRVRTAGANLALTLTMGEISDSWIPMNGFDNVAVSVFMDTRAGKGRRDLPRLNAKMPGRARWDYAHVASGWASYMYDTRNASATIQGDKLGLSPTIKVDKEQGTITFLYEGARFGMDSWQGTTIYISTWEHNPEGEFIDILPQPSEWLFGGGDAGSAKILDSILVTVEPWQIDSGRLDQVLDRYVGKKTHPFIHARVEDAWGRLIYEHTATNPALVSQDIDGDTWMRIWSMSKLITTMLTLDLIEEGRLALNDPVARYLPELADLRVAVATDGDSLATLSASTYSDDGGQNIDRACPYRTQPMQTVMTVEHLLTHKAGFYYATTNLPCLDQPLAAAALPEADSSRDFLRRIARLPLIQQPGDDYFYGLNTTVLGMLLERVTGMSLQQLVAARLTDPLNIDGLRYGLPSAAGLLPRFSGSDGAVRRARDEELDIFGGPLPGYAAESELFLGGEGMIGTARGYAGLLRSLLVAGMSGGPDILDAATIRDMVSAKTQTDNDYGHGGYAVWVNSGLRSDGSYGRGGLWTGGGYEGTRYWVDPKHNLVGVIMSQLVDAPKEGWDMENDFRAVLDEFLEN